MEEELGNKREEHIYQGSTRLHKRSTRNFSKSSSRYPVKKRSRKEPTFKQELLFLRGAVSFIIVVIAFAIAKYDNSMTEVIRQKLKVAISENVSFEEISGIGAKGIEMLYTFKEEQTEKIDATIEEEIFLPVDSQSIN